MSAKPLLPGALCPSSSSSSGGGTITTPQVAYITSAGNDTTGDGSINKPFRTAQKAYDADFYYWHLGANFDAGSVNFGGDETVYLYILGEGPLTILGDLVNHGQVLYIFDLGIQTFKVSSVNTSGVSGPGNQILLNNVFVQNDVNSSGANGATENTGSSVVLIGLGTIFGNIVTTGGNGADAQDGAVGGSVSISREYQIIGNITTSGGTGDNPGADGAISIERSTVVGTLTPNVATVRGATIGNLFYANTYPLAGGTTTPVTSITTIADSVSVVS